MVDLNGFFFSNCFVFLSFFLSSYKFIYSEWLIRNVTDLMVANGYKEAGYEYVIIDDCWLEMERDPVSQEMLADRKRFPSGIKALADYVS